MFHLNPRFVSPVEGLELHVIKNLSSLKLCHSNEWVRHWPSKLEALVQITDKRTDACSRPLCIYTEIWIPQQPIKKKTKT